ncbi:MAG: sialate O-acetylesterase [Pirellulaceae bacterium]|nr:sialate O-acetylesterase [Pirellulaceae bacterium]
MQLHISPRSLWVAALTLVLFTLEIDHLSGAVTMPAIFGDQMILQRGLAAPIWGWANPDEEVTVRFATQEHAVIADHLGRWQVRLMPLKADRAGRTLEISATNKITYQDVLVGDVWICSGQSNMEWQVQRSLNGKAEIATAKHPTMRIFNVPGHVTSPLPLREIAGHWQAVTPHTIGGFSAVGYFFGRELHLQTMVPIGLIGSNWGGTRIEPWTPPAGIRLAKELKGFDEFINRFDPETPTGKETWRQFIEDTQAWVTKASHALETGDLLPPPVTPPLDNHAGVPTAIYNAMIHPLVPFGIRGAIWYQGEANGNEGLEYFFKMKALLGGWRHVFGHGDFPLYFYFVQLANFQQPNDNPAGGDGWARVREAQRQALTLPHTGMAVTTDIGEAKDIHPRNKQDVGLRLARWALRDIFGSKEVVSGPLFRELTIERDRVRVHFDHVGDGLMVGVKRGLTPTAEDITGSLQRFAIAGENRKWHWAEAKIERDTVVVSSDNVPNPVAVRYAYSMNPAGANLYNRAGLPAAPFRTDQW